MAGTGTESERRGKREGAWPNAVRDPLGFLARAGYAARPRRDGRYDVEQLGVLDAAELADLWVRVVCWPVSDDWLPLIRGRRRDDA